MPITVKHSKTSAIPDAGDANLVQPSDWNADHTLTGLGTMAEQNANAVAITGGTISGVTLPASNITGTLGVPNGGTGATTLTGYVKGAGTSAFTAAATIPNTDITGLGTASTKDAGAALGVATLDAGGKVPVSELPAAVLGALSYQGTWNASTNTPTLTSSVGDKGYYYVVSVAGNTNLNGITDWLVGDWAVFNGSIWQKVDNTETVTSVNGQIGAVVLTTTDVAEGTNLYYTDTRARASNSAGTGISYDSATGVITNSAPDQTVVLTAGTGISTSGTYPNFTITNTSPSSGGTVTSVTGTAPVVSSGGNTPAISLASGYGDTQNPYASKTANFVLAAPNGSAGAPTFRAVVAADIPTLNQNTTGSAATLTTGRTIAITGDLSYTSPSFNGSANVTAAGTLATVNANVGSFTNASVTVNGKGLVTAVSSGTAPVTSVTGTAPVVSSGGATPAISMAAATTSVNGYLTSTDWNTFNNKTSNTGTVTSVGGTGTVNGITLTGTVTTSGNLTLGGTLSGVNLASQVTGTLPIANGGTGQTTATAAFNALNPMTTTGDILYESSPTVAARLGIGSTGQVLTVAGGLPSWAAAPSSNITALGLYENSATISANYTIGTGNNAMSAGPITINTSITVTVPTGSSWVIV